MFIITHSKLKKIQGQALNMYIIYKKIYIIYIL